ncbi:hypothetical protein VTH82DRAFT_6215 [Thermothelomyces myriococcoides]
MRKKSSGFSIPGFVCLAPSIYVQDSRLTGDGINPCGGNGSGGGGVGGVNATFSLPSIRLPQDPAVQSNSRSGDASPPDLIIITSWTGAAAKHVAKYTSAYNALYPGVPILVITTAVSDLVLRSTRRKLKALAPAVTYLLSEEPSSPQPVHTTSSTTSSSPPSSPSSSQLCRTGSGHPHQPPLPPPPPPPAITTTTSPTAALPPHPITVVGAKESTARLRFSSLLLHAFSEGGAHKAVLLARAYLSAVTTPTPTPTTTTTTTTTTRARGATAGGNSSSGGNGGESRSKQLPVRALILDSAPGTSASLGRLAQGVARALPRGTPKPVARGVAAGLVGVSAALRRDHRDRDLINGTRRALNDPALWGDLRRMSRTYLFGEEDEVVWWRDVHRHAVESATVIDADSSGLGKDEKEEKKKDGDGGGGGGGGGGGVGVGSLVVRFKRTGHCAHAKGTVNQAIYWAAVRTTWEMGIGNRANEGEEEEAGGQW